MASLAGLSRELIFVILQFLDEENHKESAHRLESESGVFCNLKYIEELVGKGEFDELEKYLRGFIHVGENRYSVKMLFEIQKQKYLEALDRNEGAKALKILNEDLRVFKSFNEDLFRELTHLLTIGNIREKPELSKYTDTKTARDVLFGELKKLIERNPEVRDKCQFPSLKNSRLRLLVNHSLNWQHHLCRNPKPNPDITTLLEDHSCGPPNAAQAPAPVQANHSSCSLLIRSAGFHPPLQAPDGSLIYATPRGQGTIVPYSFPQLAISGGLVRAPHNTGDTELVLRKARHFEVSEEIRNLPTSSVAHPGPSHIHNFLPSDDLPKKVISSFHQGSDVKTMDFHPEHQNMLLVGTNTGDIAIWEVGTRLRIAHRSFSVWNIRECSMAFQESLANEHPVMVNRVMWCPEGLVLGVAYSKHIVHIHTYRAGQDLRDHLEIEAHVGSVNDLAFIIQDQKLLMVTCGEDKTVKVWDAATGINHHIFEGHEAPVYSVCPQSKRNIQFTLSTAMDATIKAWVLRETGSRVSYDAPGRNCTKMAYSADGLRLFSSGSTKEGDTYLLEWNESEGSVKQTYHGLGKYVGDIHFDMTKKFLAAGDDHSVKFWDMDNTHLLGSTNAEGGLPALPCIRFNKDGTLLAVSTSENGVKILGNAEGLGLVRSVENHTNTRTVAFVAVSKTSTINASGASTSLAGAQTPFPDRSVPLPVIATLNQDSQHLPQVISRNQDEFEFPIVWRPKEITQSSQLRSLRIFDNALQVRIVRLVYANLGSGILALGYNAEHRLWKWKKTVQNPTAKATVDVAPQLWQPTSGTIMINDIKETNLDDIVPCMALSKNNSYCMSSSGGKVNLFNMSTFKTMTSFMNPPPAATCLVFHPQDNNIIAVGLSDFSIHIYNVRLDKVQQKLNGHQNCVTGLTFSIDKKILISSGADAQLCMWSTESWEKLTSNFLKFPSCRSNNPQAETRVYFNLDQTRLLVVHETQIAIYDPIKLECIMQWVPLQAKDAITDAVYSCDGLSVFVSIEDGSVNVLSAHHLMLKCQINYAAYMPYKHSAIRVYPNAIAAHPSIPNQLALGLSDGGVYVLEPLESDKQWGSDPLIENSAGPSTNHVAVAADYNQT